LLTSFLRLSSQRLSLLFPYTTLFRSVTPYEMQSSNSSRYSRLFWRVLLVSAATVAVVILTREGAVSCTSCTSLLDSTATSRDVRSEEHTSELQSLRHLVCRLLLEKKK